MRQQNVWSRRNFIKAASIAGGIALMSGTMQQQGQAAASPTTQPRSGDKATTLDTISLAGVSDIHVHAAPDTKARSIDELSFCRAAHKAGYRSVMFKSNDWSCHDRAYLVRQALPEFTCFGSLCMNWAHGDKVNVYAARMAVQTTDKLCRCIWMPTLAASYQQSYEKQPRMGIPVLSATGTVLPEVVQVMEICAEANIIFASGHSSPQENIVLAKKAKEVGVGKFVITHANSHIWKMSPAQIQQVVDLGGYIEYSYITNLAGPGTGVPSLERMSDAEFVAYAKLAPERSFITTDLGQVNMPHPLEGMRLCIAALLAGGMSQRDIDYMVRTNPANLMGISA